MNFPQDEDPNVRIDMEIEKKLFDERFNSKEFDFDFDQYNFEMRPYIYPDVE